jgi:hypothetical protein
VASAKAGMKAYNTVALSLDDVQVDADSGPAFLVRDSKALELNRVTTRKALAGVPVVRLDGCAGAVVRVGRIPLSTGVGELKSLAIEGNPVVSESKVNYWTASEPAKEGAK